MIWRRSALFPTEGGELQQRLSRLFRLERVNLAFSVPKALLTIRPASPNRGALWRGSPMARANWARAAVLFGLMAGLAVAPFPAPAADDAEVAAYRRAVEQRFAAWLQV